MAVLSEKVMRGGRNPLVVELKSRMALLLGASPVELIPTLWACTLKAKTVSRQAARNIFVNFFIVVLIFNLVFQISF
jgi:Na+/phosphate symporter